MAEDWFADVQKYVPGADEGVVKKIVNYLGIALRNRDSSLVSFSDPEEVNRVKERFLAKKLGLTDSGGSFDRALGAVKDMMSADRTKNRVTVYYLLADWFGKLDLFGGSASPSGGFSFGSGAAAAAAGAAGLATAAAAKPETVTSMPPPRAADTGTGGATTIGDGRTSDAGTEAVHSAPPPSYAADVDDGDGGGGIPGWLKWLLLLAALLLLFFLLKSCMADRDHAADANAAAGTAATADANMSADGNVAVAGDATTATAAAVPAGAGVVAGTKDEKPMLTVYFDVGKREVSNDLAAQAATLKTYLDANAGSKLAVSGYNDPSGNAAANAELSKNRAQAVKAALVAAGIPDASVELVKPADTTAGGVTPEQARRVEVTIQ